MKFTYRDIVWVGIIALIVAFLSTCHRNKSHSIVGELVQQSKAKDSAYMVERQQADNKLNVLIGQMQNAAARQQATEQQLSQSLTTIARLSAGVRRAKEQPIDSTFTMVSPEYIDYCDSLAITGERVYDEYSDYKKKTSYLILAKDTAIRQQGAMLKQERASNEACIKDYGELLRRFRQAALPRNQLYLGAELIGSQYTLMQNVGVVVSIKTKSNKLWQISGGLQSNGGYYGRINGNILISLKR